jgi:uncharacterized protein (TIGR04551 family)
MPRFQLPSSILFSVATTCFCAVAAAQQPTSGAPPAPPKPTAPATDATPAPGASPKLPVPAAVPAAAPAPATPGATIDRGALLLPAPAKPPPPAAPAPPADSERRTDGGQVGTSAKDTYAEDWWAHARPVVELHGYFRVRAELFHGFALGRTDVPEQALWPQPSDNSYTDTTGTPRNVGLYCNGLAQASCENKSQAGANMRFRVNPELHISDNLRVMSQIDMLDNLVLGSTPDSTSMEPSTNAYQTAAGALYSYQTAAGNPYAPVGALSTTQQTPTAGVNGFKNSIAVKRAWGEYVTPVGQLRFGRMPDHWGLGMVYNSGDTYDSDWQSTIDRIMFVTGIKPLDLYFAGAWDFPNEGPTSGSAADLNGGQPYDLAQLDDVNQYTAMVLRRRDPELAKLDLAQGKVVVNGGARLTYRNQFIAYDPAYALSTPPADADLRQRYVNRGFKQFVPDLWLQLLYKKFRFEAEGVMVSGSFENTSLSVGGGTANLSYKLRQYGLATQTEFKAVEDRLRLQFGFGWASGDNGVLPDINRTSTLSASRGGSVLADRAPGDRTYREFRFHPDYRVDLILWRHVMNRVQGGYYFRPSVDYDFSRSANGQRLGGGAAIVWSRASEFVQTPGHARDLGIEADLSLYFQSKDGVLNDNPDRMGGFFTMLQYGVLFPLGGLGGMLNEAVDTSTVHTLRWFVGILY